MRKYLLWLGIVLAAICGLTQCQKKSNIKIGVSQCSNDDWRNKMNAEIEREIMFHPGAQVEIRSANDNSQKQIEDIRYFMDNNFDIIIAAPNEANAVTPVIKEAYSKGIPVIVFDRNINGDSYSASITADNIAIGNAAAQYAASIVDSAATVIEICGLRGNTPAQGRHEGFKQQAQKSGLNTYYEAV
ncbi:MAG: substrate-binding domain-containing protein [Muribaculaceae bacterium]|nr:substrate-binding domain-containing protein [Muribaculaceae bacterium]